MRKYFILCTLIFSISTIGYAQVPTKVIYPDNAAKNRGVLITCPEGEQDAGTFHLGNYKNTTQSNHINKNRIFLCAQDRVPLIHNRDAVLKGDPKPGTTPGIGYGIYTCSPTVDGTNLSDIASDPCQENDPMPPAPSEFWVIVDGTEGDIMLNNNGYLNQNFNHGAPGTWWFAPITFDKLDVNNGVEHAAYEVDGANNKGPCVNVRIDQAIEVTYLNPFEISDFTYNNSGNGPCSGSFVITGGLPEYDPAAHYDISIVSANNSNILGSLQGMNYGNGDTVNFTVPLGGKYMVTIKDGKSCVQTIPLTLDCNTLKIILPELQVELGETFTFPIRVKNFDSLATLSFTMQYNPNVIEFIDTANFDIPKDKSISGVSVNQLKGKASFTWATTLMPQTKPITLPDGTAIIEFKFEVASTAKIGDISPLILVNKPTYIEATRTETLEEMGVIVDEGFVEIVAGSDLIFSWTSCGTAQGPPHDGTFTITAYNGTPPYAVAWVADNIGDSGTGTINNDGGSYTASGLDYDTYTVTITDKNNLTYTDKLVVNSVQPHPEFLVTVYNPSCHGEDDGKISLNNIQAVQPYAIQWSTGDFNVTSIDDLAAGNYSVTVTDKYGCAVDSARALGYEDIVLTVSSENVACQDDTTGSAVITAAGGVPLNGNEYTFTLEDDSQVTTDTLRLSNLPYGWYTLTITDKNACPSQDSFFIDSDRKLYFKNLVITSPSCYGELGQLHIEPGVTGGNVQTPYTVRVKGVNSSYDFTQNAFDEIDFTVPGGKYHIILGDQSECSFDTIVTVIQPEEIIISPQVQNDLCEPGFQGYIALHASGGTGELTFDWAGGLFPSAADSIWDLPPGNYSVTITDENNCTLEKTFQITSAEAPVITQIDSVSISCSGGCDGELTVQATPGPNPIAEYYWVNAITNDTIHGQTATGLCSGNYIVYVVDEKGCATNQVVHLGNPDPIDTASIVIVNPTCTGRNTGSIQLEMEGGTPPYTFKWSEPGAANSSTLSGVGAGTYTVSVTDDAGCGPFVAQFTITEPPKITVEFDNIKATSCYNTCDGRATAVASGGVSNTYTYTWGNNHFGQLNTALCAGKNLLIVSDGTCTDSFYVTIPSPEPISFNYIDSIPPTCNGDSDGKITIEGTGGTGSYIYLWEDQSIDSSLTNLTAGDYAVTITDGKGCVLDTVVTLGEPDVLELSIDSLSHISCAGEQDGYIELGVTGGNGDFVFNWSRGSSTTAIASSLAQGNYAITVTDKKGCTDTISTTLNTPPPISFTMDDIVNPTCYGDEAEISVLSATGGNGTPYIAVINDQEFPVPGSILLPAGSYTVSVFDEKGCSSSSTFTINQPPEIIIGLPGQVEVDLGDSLSLNPTISNATAPISEYAWMPPEYVDCSTCKNVSILPISSTTLTFTVKDENGCTAEATVDVHVDKSRDVYIPTAFTPNGDGVNEVFKIYTGSSAEKIINFAIYNRWGSVIWKASDIPIVDNASALGWNGTFKGNSLNPGVFVFTAKILFKDGVTRTYSGDISILDSYTYH